MYTFLSHRTTEFLMRHLAKVAAFGKETGMHSKNLAIVWAPNLLRYKMLHFFPVTFDLIEIVQYK